MAVTPAPDSQPPELMPEELAPEIDSLNPWHYKPWWCRPWSIALTGMMLISGSWWVFHWRWLTLLVALPVSVWMGFFLLIWPRLMREYLREYSEVRSHPVDEQL